MESNEMYDSVLTFLQLYRSADGALEENRDTETATTRLKEMIEKLQQSLAPVDQVRIPYKIIPL
jgi:hypothetical protein